ncbi:MAG TPA: hypothetical protein VGB98_10755 [Pyrinomonadaceae bacterium]|jgi:hypothetical protein
MTDERIIAYLLEELPEEDSKRFEEECFARESWPDQISLVEDDLIDGYLRGDLTPEQRRRFEQNYLITPARLERVRAAAVLIRYGDEYKTGGLPTVALPTPRGWSGRLRAFWGDQGLPLRLAAALVVSAVVFGGLWLLLSDRSSPRRVAMLTLLSSPNNRLEGPRAGRVTLTAGVDALRITLRLPDGAPQATRYRVELESLESVDGRKINVEAERQDAQSVRVEISTARLEQGRYAVKLTADKPDGTAQRVGNYFFIVE